MFDAFGGTEVTGRRVSISLGSSCGGTLAGGTFGDAGKLGVAPMTVPGALVAPGTVVEVDGTVAADAPGMVAAEFNAWGPHWLQPAAGIWPVMIGDAVVCGTQDQTGTRRTCQVCVLHGCSVLLATGEPATVGNTGRYRVTGTWAHCERKSGPSRNDRKKPENKPRFAQGLQGLQGLHELQGFAVTGDATTVGVVAQPHELVPAVATGTVAGAALTFTPTAVCGWQPLHGFVAAAPLVTPGIEITGEPGPTDVGTTAAGCETPTLAVRSHSSPG